ncbi:hypothetical protein ACVMHY_007418 [Bradyrhizobium barranii subsp. barranii]
MTRGERKAALKKIITGSDVQFSESFEIDGGEIFAHACKVGLEGVVSIHSSRGFGRTCDGCLAGAGVAECRLTPRTVPRSRRP